MSPRRAPAAAPATATEPAPVALEALAALAERLEAEAAGDDDAEAADADADAAMAAAVDADAEALGLGRGGADGGARGRLAAALGAVEGADAEAWAWLGGVAERYAVGDAVEPLAAAAGGDLAAFARGREARRAGRPLLRGLLAEALARRIARAVAALARPAPTAARTEDALAGVRVARLVRRAGRDWRAAAFDLDLEVVGRRVGLGGLAPAEIRRWPAIADAILGVAGVAAPRGRAAADAWALLLERALLEAVEEAPAPEVDLVELEAEGGR